MIPLSDLIAPVILSDTANVAVGGISVLDSSKLQAPGREALVITEIRFFAPYTTQAVGYSLVDTSPRTQATAVRAKINLGPFPITNEFVGIGMFAPYVKTNEYTMPFLLQATTEGFGVGGGFFRWVLPKPLFVPSGLGFQIQLQRRSTQNAWEVGDTADTTALTVEVSIVGYYTKAHYKNMFVPFASNFLGSYYDDSGSTLYEWQSGQGDLANRTGKELNTEYMIGRFLRHYRSIGGTYGYQEFEDTGETGGSSFPVQVKIVSSETRLSPVPAYEIFNLVFDHHRRLMPFRRKMASNEYLYASILATPAYNVRNYFAPSLSIVGWRKESI